jgi:hypothetical protein
LARRCLLRRSLALGRLLLWGGLAGGRLLLRRRGRLLALLGECRRRSKAHGRHQRDGGELPTSASPWFESSVFGIAHDARLLARPCAPAK